MARRLYDVHRPDPTVPDRQPGHLTNHAVVRNHLGDCLGAYSIEATFDGLTTPGLGTVQVTTESGALAYTGDTRATADTAINLSGSFTQDPDGSLAGDVTKAGTAVFTITDDVSSLEVGTFNADVQDDGTFTTSIPAGLASGFYMVALDLAPNNYFSASSVTSTITIP